MPQRNEVPSLKLLSLRKVAWPDGVDRTETDPHPSAEQYCRAIIYPPYLQEQSKKSQRGLEKDPLKEISSQVINSWISLSNYFKSPLTDIKTVDMFFLLDSPEVLDFLGEGFGSQLISENETEQEMLRFVSIVPRKIPLAQPIDPPGWNKIIETLQNTNSIQNVKELSILFGNRKESDSENQNTNVSERITYNFEAFKEFSNLTKLVIRGKGDDTVLEAIGANCYKLKYLDISRSNVTTKGIRLIFYKGEEEENSFRDAFTSRVLWNLPKYLLRPLTKQLEYFDMSDIPGLDINVRYECAITMACPQLVATPTKFFFAPNGTTKINCKGFESSPTFIRLRQELVLHVRSLFCQDLFCFVRGFLACGYFPFPSVEVRVDDVGHEVSFVLLSQSLTIAYVELESLTIVNFNSYTKSAAIFIPLELISSLAPNLKRLKASLKGVVSEKYSLKALHHVSCPMIHRLETLQSLVKLCPKLKYLEIREVLFSPAFIKDSDIVTIFEDGAEHLETLRFIFKSRISLLTGLTCILTNCPSIRLIGDLRCWQILPKAVQKLVEQLQLHNFKVALEYDGIIHYSDNVCKELTGS